MSQAVQLPGDCCATCPDEATTQIPGPQGPAGTPGTNGTNGADAYTALTASFVMPAELANVQAHVGHTDWLTVGQLVFVQFAGVLQVVSKDTALLVTLKNLADTGAGLYPGNAAPATVIPNLSTVSASGAQGTTGSTGVSSLDDISPTTTKGDLIVDDGTNSPDASDTRLPAGTDTRVLHANSADPLGLTYKVVDMSGVATAITGILPIANGGTGQIRPAAVQGAARNLVLANIPGGTTYTIRTKLGASAEQLVVMDAGGNAFCLHGFGANLDINPGVNPIGTAGGLDAGLYPVVPTWFYVWCIYNGSAASAVFSRSSTAPTLAGGLAGYTYTAFLGCIYFDTAIPGFVRSLQYGNQVAIQETEVFTDQAGSTTASPRAGADISAIVPAMAKSYSGTMGVSTDTGGGIAAPWGITLSSDSDGLVGAVTFNASDAAGVVLNGFLHCSPFSLLISSSPPTMAYLMTDTEAKYRVTISGYTI